LSEDQGHALKDHPQLGQGQLTPGCRPFHEKDQIHGSPVQPRHQTLLEIHFSRKKGHRSRSEHSRPDKSRPTPIPLIPDPGQAITIARPIERRPERDPRAHLPEHAELINLPPIQRQRIHVLRQTVLRIRQDRIGILREGVEGCGSPNESAHCYEEELHDVGD
jgi:hypothetical protein